MKLGTIIIVLFVLALIAAGAFIFLASTGGSGEPQPYAEEVSLEQRSANAGVISALAAGGIDSAMADVSANQVYIAYDLPAGTDADIMQQFALGVAGSAAENSKNIVVLQYQDEKPKTAWTVSAADFDAFMRKQITAEQLDARIAKQNF
jgi:hypothetical protein